MDMSAAYIKGARESIPDAEITFDRLHVVKLLNEAAKVRDRGYRTTENFITMAYLVCGKLAFNLPT